MHIPRGIQLYRLKAGYKSKADAIEALKKNGVLIYLERDIEKLIDFDRPLSKNGAISRLFEQRRPIYEAVCDKKVSNDGCLGETVKEILKIWKYWL